MKGRKAKPTDLKVIQGTFRKDRAPANEPRPEKLIEVPRPPTYLNKYAKKMWRRISGKLVSLGVLTEMDLESLEMCCSAYGEYRAAYEAVYPRIIDEETGKKRRQTFSEYMRGRNSQTMPEYITMKTMYATFKSYATEFGLTAVSRGRIDLPDPGDAEDPMERMWNEG